MTKTKKEKTVTEEEAVGTEKSYQELIAHINPIAQPLAPRKLSKKLYKCVKKGTIWFVFYQFESSRSGHWCNFRCLEWLNSWKCVFHLISVGCEGSNFRCSLNFGESLCILMFSPQPPKWNRSAGELKKCRSSLIRARKGKPCIYRRLYFADTV